MNQKETKKFIRNYCRRICRNENLNNLYGVGFIDFKKSDRSLGKNFYKIVKNKDVIAFRKSMLDISKFENKYKYPVWVIILHEIAHLKEKGHDIDFNKYLCSLMEKYTCRRFYWTLFKKGVVSKYISLYPYSLVSKR